MNNEPLLDKNNKRYTLFPIQHMDLWEYYKKIRDSHWIPEEVDLSNDLHDWKNKLNDSERHFIKNTVGFFSASDIIIADNIVENLNRKVQIAEAKMFYDFQAMQEGVHSHLYSLLIETYVRDIKERERLFNAIETIPSVKKKAEWAFKWMDNGTFQEQLIAFVCIEGIHFSSSFCSVFWLRNRGLMPGLCDANDFISSDENFHMRFGIHLYNKYIVNKLPLERVKQIVLEALDLEKEFATESLPVSLIGINKTLMKQYLEYVADNILQALNIPREFNSPQPFKFMETIALENKANFFEQRPNEYSVADTSGKVEFDEDF